MNPKEMLDVYLKRRKYLFLRNAFILEGLLYGITYLLYGP